MLEPAPPAAPPSSVEPPPDRELALVMLLLGVSGALREVALSDSHELERLRPRCAGFFDGVSCEIEEHLTRERVMRRMQWLECSLQLAEALAGRDSRQRDLHRLVVIRGGRRLPRRHDNDD